MTGSENLRKPEIRAMNDEQLISQASVVLELAKYAFKGRPASHPGVSSRDALSALLLIGKHVGMFWAKGAPNRKLEYEIA